MAHIHNDLMPHALPCDYLTDWKEDYYYRDVHGQLWRLHPTQDRLIPIEIEIVEKENKTE